MFVSKGHNGCVLTTGWSHSEQYLVSGSADKTVRVWTMTAASASATMAASASGARDQSPVLVIDAMGHNLKQQDKSHPKVGQVPTLYMEVCFVTANLTNSRMSGMRSSRRKLTLCSFTTWINFCCFLVGTPPISTSIILKPSHQMKLGGDHNIILCCCNQSLFVQFLLTKFMC